MILPQEKLSSDTLLEEVWKMVANLDHYRRKGEKAKELVDFSAADKIADEIVKLVS